MRRRGRFLLVAVAVAVVAGSVALWRAVDAGEPIEDAGDPPRLVIGGHEFRHDGGAGLLGLRLDDADPRLMHVETMDEVFGTPPRCQRRTVVRVVAEDDSRVVLESSEYRRVDRGPEEKCPFPEPEPMFGVLRLAQPLGDRDVAEAAFAAPLHVDGRTEPSRTPVRGTPSCAETSSPRPNSGDFASFIRHGGRSYVSSGREAAAPRFGAPLGTVRCRLSESLTPSHRYRLRDGDAGYLDAGTPYYAVDGVLPQEAIGATFDGRRLVFTYDPTLE